MSDASLFRLSSRRAVRISFRESGEARAYSSAVDLPIPLEAPVIRIVLPCRRFEREDILRAWAVRNVDVFRWVESWERRVVARMLAIVVLLPLCGDVRREKSVRVV